MKKNLTEKQQAFIKDYAGGMSAPQAFKNNYSCSNNEEAKYKAEKLLANPLISKEIEKIQEKKRKSINYSSSDSFSKLLEIQEKALQKGDLTNALKAEEMKGKLMGFFKNSDNVTVGAVGDFKEFYAQICAKKDYGNAGEEKSQSKSDVLAISPKTQEIENK